MTEKRPQGTTKTAFTRKRGSMKVIVADKISERGVELLKETGWKIVATTKETLGGELADAEALIVRSATKVTADLLDKAPRLRVVGRAAGNEYAGRKFGQRRRAYLRFAVGAGAPGAQV